MSSARRFFPRVTALRDLVLAPQTDHIAQEWMDENVEKHTHQLLQKTANDPNAGSPIAEERASSSGRRCQNLIVQIVKILQVFLYRSQLDLIINSCSYV